MIKIEDTHVDNIVRSVYSARNAMNSWDKSDSDWKTDTLGENDLALAKKLSKAGSDHAKYLRMINVSLDLTAPLYFWKQFDQYKVGVTTNSCSTMHKIHDEKITIDDFSFDGHEDLEFDDEVYVDDYGQYMKFDELMVKLCEELRCKYLKTNDKRYWRYLIQLLPSSYNQKRTVQLNYQVLKSMYFARRNHRLDEWHTFCGWMETLPYFKEVCVDVCEV